MKITQADMDSRNRMVDLKISLTNAVAKHEGITCGELLVVLAEMMLTWARYLRKDELNEEEEGTDEQTDI